MNNPNLHLDPPSSSSTGNNCNVEEDPTTPKTIHMTRNPFSSNTNSTNNNNTSNLSNKNDNSNNPHVLNASHNASLYLLNDGFPTNSNTNSNDVIHTNHTNSTITMNGPPQLSLPTNSDDGSTTGSTTRFQRSIPVHRRIHNPNNNLHSHNSHYNNNNNTHGFMSVTSSTRSVKSVGSSIIDTEDDDKSQQTGLLSLMSQDYVVESHGGGGLSTNASIVESVKSSDVPRVVPKGNGNDDEDGDDTIDLETDEEEVDHNEDDDDVDNANEHNHHHHGSTSINGNNDDTVVEFKRTRSGVKLGRSSSGIKASSSSSSSMGLTMTAKIMEKCFRQMQMNLERGLRDIKEQNRRDHDRGELLDLSPSISHVFFIIVQTKRRLVLELSQKYS